MIGLFEINIGELLSGGTRIFEGGGEGGADLTEYRTIGDKNASVVVSFPFLISLLK